MLSYALFVELKRGIYRLMKPNNIADKMWKEAIICFSLSVFFSLFIILFFPEVCFLIVKEPEKCFKGVLNYGELQTHICQDFVEICKTSKNCGDLVAINRSTIIPLCSNRDEKVVIRKGLELTKHDMTVIHLNKLVMMSLPPHIVRVSRSLPPWMKDNCPICLEPFRRHEQYVRLRCMHKFHLHELMKLISKKCPSCGEIFDPTEFVDLSKMSREKN